MTEAPVSIHSFDPFFVLGFPRSGTSALRLHLTCHPGLVIPPECSFLTWLRRTFGDWSTGDTDTSRLDDFLKALAGARKFDTWRLDLASVRDLMMGSHPRTYAQLASCVYRAYAESAGKPQARWGDKNNVHLTQVDDLNALYPQAQFVLIVRDVRDVLASVRDLSAVEPNARYRPQITNDAAELGEAWRRENASALDALAEVAPGRYTVIRYEDFVAAPDVLLSEVLAFLGEEWDPSVLLAPERNKLEELEPPETMPWKGLTLEPLTSARVGRWKATVAPEDAAAAVEAAGGLFARLGYDRVVSAQP